MARSQASGGQSGGQKGSRGKEELGGAGGSLDSNMKRYLWRAYLLHPTLPSSPAKSVTLESTSAGPNGPSKQGQLGRAKRHGREHAFSFTPVSDRFKVWNPFLN